MAVVFETFDQILVDGVAAGNIVDVISNHAPRRAEVLTAFNMFRDSLIARQDEELSAQNTELKEQKAELESEKLTLTSQVSTLTSEKSALTSQVATLTSQVESLNTALATANARIVHLTNELPFNPREISVTGFKARLFQVLETEDVVRMYAVDSDPILKQVASTIANWDSQYPIRLDSQELQQPLGYLVSIDLLTPEEVVFLRQDCTRAEAYFAPEEE